uniref:Leucine-binding protein domain-containing protein n=1 Tax=Streptomyces avermitilis TaxID=33903 RepID=A0A499VPB2_STRAX|nr:hypothetical protein SAVMC3_74190 [Streptomyces avermitilis]
MRRRARLRAAETAAAVLLLLVGAGCGSRLPESDFAHRSAPPASRRTEPVRVGILTSATSPVGGSAFTGPRDGARAYFDRLNARGASTGGRSTCGPATTAAAASATTSACTG